MTLEGQDHYPQYIYGFGVWKSVGDRLSVPIEQL